MNAEITSIPLRWTEVRLKYLGCLKGGVGFPDAEQGQQGEALPFFKVKHLGEPIAGSRLRLSEHTISRSTAARLGAFVFPKNTVVFAKVGAALLLNRFCILDQESCIDNNMMGLIVEPTQANLQFMLHSLSLMDFAQIANPGAVPSLNMEQVAEQRVLIPPLPMQRAIADYLDRETGRLDALVAAKERWLELLAEKRRALITQAVTRGLNPNAALRDSGIPWLGQIPKHWEVVPLRYLVSFVSGATPDKGNAEFWNGEIPWVSPKDMKRDIITDSEDHVTEEALEASTLRLLPVGTVLVVVRGMILAHSFPTALTSLRVTINQDMKGLCCREQMEPSFLRDFLKGIVPVLVSLMEQSAHGTRKLETEVLGNLGICVPPLSEQRAIVAHIEWETAKLDALRSATEQTIALLRERRAALISEAVCGRIDTVRMDKTA